GFALGLAQCHYTPSFHGYLAQAQRNLVETYLQRKVWSYWVYESMWGHFNFTNFDPARYDNIMLTGWYGMHVGQYLLNSGDRLYGTTYVREILPKWLDKLEKEFTDGKGSLYGLRSYWTGLAMPFYSGEAGFAFFANVFSPELGRRLWAIGRKELEFCIAKDA